MSQKRKRRPARTNSAKRPTSRSRRRRRRRPGWANPLAWGVVAIVTLLVVLALQQSGAFARPPTPSRDPDLTDALPLAEAGRPLKGGYNTSLIPRQTPAPREAPKNVSLPVLELPSTTHDFGSIPKRPDVSHVFAVRNTGDADLQISNLVTSCGCTTAELSSSVIPPGQRADLTVVFDPDFHETQGLVTRVVWFATNDPTQPWVEVQITADVQR